MRSPGTVPFRKGHGTGNDFVVLPDPDGALQLTPTIVRALCDRRFGLGADGVLRVVRSASAPDAPKGGTWFMDYWNADGSGAEMCGNGARVFARHLVDTGAEPAGEFLIGTRGGARSVRVPDSGQVRVQMGSARGADEPVEVRLGTEAWPATTAFVPNPHAVAFVADPAALGDLAGATAAPAAVYPDGVNIEFVAVDPDTKDRITLRALERGSGETLSCGTGACAAAWVHRQVNGGSGPVTVGVPGGELVVEIADDGEITLSGPALFVADGHLDPAWWEAVA